MRFSSKVDDFIVFYQSHCHFSWKNTFSCWPFICKFKKVLWFNILLLFFRKHTLDSELFSGPVLDYFCDLLDDFTSFTMGVHPPGGHFFLKKCTSWILQALRWGVHPPGGHFFEKYTSWILQALLWGVHPPGGHFFEKWYLFGANYWNKNDAQQNFMQNPLVITPRSIF